MLTDRRASLQAAVKRRVQQKELQSRALSARLTAVRAELAQLESNIALQRTRASLASASQARERELRRQGFVSDEAMQGSEERRIDQYARLGELQRNRLTLQRDALALREELDGLPLKADADLAEIQREIATVEQQLAEAESRREVVVPAPAAGVVTTLQAELGGRPNSSVPLLSIVPAGSHLDAHLFTPSRAIGFLRPASASDCGIRHIRTRSSGTTTENWSGSPARQSIRRKCRRSFGSDESRRLQRSGLSPRGPTRTTVRVGLRQAGVAATGMQLDADVLIERRRLIEWVLDPLFTLTGKWSR